jgi:hypothetical protein
MIPWFRDSLGRLDPLPDATSLLAQSLRAASIELHFAEMKDLVKEKLKAFEMFQRLGTGSFYVTLGASVDAYLADYAADWKP